VGPLTHIRRPYGGIVLFDVRVLAVGDWDVVNVVGDMDLAGLPAVRQALDRTDSPSVAIDLSGVDHLDPVALGVVLLGALRSSRSGGRFVVVSPPGPARNLLVETGVDQIVTVVDDSGALD